MTSLPHQLSEVSRLWLDPAHPLRQVTISALQVSTGLSHRQIELALSNCFEELTFSKISEYVRVGGSSLQMEFNEAAGAVPAGESWCALHVLPSNAFTAWVHGAVITLLLGGGCALKPSTREPVFAAAWKASIEKMAPSLAERVELVSWDPATLGRFRAIVAYGSDETLEAIRKQIPPGLPFIGYGHKLSVGIVFEEAWQKGMDFWTEKIRLDAEPFRLQGCLSPQVLYMENYPHDRWPELEATLDNPPKIRPFYDWGELRASLQRYSPYLSCVGIAGCPDQRRFMEKDLEPLGVSRVCFLGEMQRPPLAWRNDGIHLPNLLN